MPDIVNRASALFQVLRVVGAKLLVLCSNLFVAHGDTAPIQVALNEPQLSTGALDNTATVEVAFYATINSY